MNILDRIFGKNKGVNKAPWSTMELITTKEWHLLEGAKTFGAFAAPGVIIHITEIEKGTTLELHEHSDASEKIVVLSGRLLFNQRIELIEGDTQYVPKGYPHEVTAMEETKLMVIFHRDYN